MRTQTEDRRTPTRLGRVFRLRVIITGLAVAAMIAGVAAATTSRTAVAPANTALPTVSGTVQQGQTLTGTTGTWTGTQPITFAFRWQRCDTVGTNCGDIQGAQAQQYTLQPADVGRTVRLVVIATNADGSTASGSNPTGLVAAVGTAPSSTKQPDPKGTAQVGRQITVDNGSWAGTTPFTFSYQWQRCNASGGSCGNIPGATSSAYVVQVADSGFRLRAIVTATNAIGSASAPSNLTALVGGTSVGAPVNTAKPGVPGGRVTAGQNITGGTGTWTGTQPIQFSYQWNRCNAGGQQCGAIAGATAITYRVTATDVGSRLQLTVRASNSAGSAIASSGVTNVVEGSGSGLPEGAVRLPGGGTSIPASSVTRPERLVISRVRFTPSPVRTRTAFTARFRVTDTRGFVVRDALVFAIGLPYNWFASGREVTTGTDGWATITVNPTRALPGGRGAAVFFVRARKAGDSLLAGVSSRRLVQVPLRITG